MQTMGKLSVHPRLQIFFRSAWIPFREIFMYIRAKTLTSFTLGKIVSAAVVSSVLMPQLEFFYGNKLPSFPYIRPITVVQI